MRKIADFQVSHFFAHNNHFLTQGCISGWIVNLVRKIADAATTDGKNRTHL